MVVAERDGIGVAEGAEAGLGGRPDAHPGDAAQRSVHRRTVVTVLGRDPFELKPHSCTGVRRAVALRVDSGPVPLPRRQGRPRLGGREHPHAVRRRTGCGVAVAQQQSSPRRHGVHADDALLDDGGDQGLEQPTGARHTQAREAPMRVGDGRVDRRRTPTGRRRRRERGGAWPASRSAPGPHASASTVRLSRLRRRTTVTGPLSMRLVRHIADPTRRKVGSPPPRRRIDQVRPASTGEGKATVRCIGA